MQDFLCLVANDELVTHGGATIWGVQHDLYGFVHVADEPDLHGTFTLRAFDSSHRGLNSFLQSRLELLVGVISRFVFLKRLNYARRCADIHTWSWFLFFAGTACLFAGLVITAIDMIFPHQFSTILEVDYDTPYDRHVIIEESFDTRNVRRKVPKIEDSFGDRIMRFAFRSYLLAEFNWIMLPAFALYSSKNVSVNCRPNFRIDTQRMRVSLTGVIPRTSCPNSRKKSTTSPARVTGRIHFRQLHADLLMTNIFPE